MIGFGLRLTDVPIRTLKTVLMVRGVRTWATLLGLLEATIWLTAMGRVMVQLGNDGLLKKIHEVDPVAFITADDTRKVIGGHRPRN